MCGGFFIGRGQSMGLFQKDNQPKTAEEYRKSAAAHQAAAKSMFYTFLKTGVFMVAALIALFLVSMAWFAINTNVRSAGVQISADNGRRFYLATRATDKQGVYDNNSQESSNLLEALRHFQRIKKTETIQGLPEFQLGATTVTGSDHVDYIVGDAGGISLMVNPTSNVNNTTQNAYVGPGSRGKITFYIIPTIAGDNQVNITVSLAAYGLSESSGNVVTAQLVNNEQLKNILCGHILLFRENDGYGNYVNQIKPVLGEDGTVCFPFTQEDTWVINQPIEITLYWIWPHRFENMVFPGQPESVFQTSGKNQEDFLNWVNSNRGYIVNQTNPDSLEEPKAGMSNSGISQWSTGYNRGDQLIGDTVAYFVWTISAE